MFIYAYIYIYIYIYINDMCIYIYAHIANSNVLTARYGSILCMYTYI